MKPMPLKWRVSLLVAWTILVGMGFIAVTAYVEMRETMVRSVDQSLHSMATSVLAVLTEAPIEAATEAEVRAIMGMSARRQGAAFRVWLDGDAGDVLANAPRPAERPDLLSAAALSGVKQPAVGSSVYFQAGQAGDQQRAVWSRAPLGERTVNVAIAISSHPVYDALEEFRNQLLYGVGFIILVTLAATTVLVGVGLRPIGGTARALSAVTDRNVGDARLEVERTPQELKPFVRAVSDMLARLARALAEQKRFVSDASHELRTPLSIARSTIDAARVKDRTPAEYRKALDEVREDLDRMAAMIEDLLVMARLDETPPAPGAETFDLADLIEDLAGPYTANLAREGGRLTLELRHATIRGDQAQVRRLFSNLLDNAARHGPTGGAVSVSITQVEAGAVQVSVHDEGGHIPPEALPHLFDRFYRTDQSRARATGGVGLGLSIAREIALRHGGDIAVMSSPELGTIFSVTLPTAREA